MKWESVFLAFVTYLNIFMRHGYGYVDDHIHRRRVEPPQQPSYISPVTYQAKASFSHAPNYQETAPTRLQVSRDNVQHHHAPREIVLRPVTYQTYDRRALEPAPASRPSTSEVRYTEPRRQYTNPRTRSSQYSQPYDSRQNVYQTSYRPEPAKIQVQHYSAYVTPQRKSQNNVIRYDYSRGSRGEERYVPSSRRVSHDRSQPQRTTFYGQPAPRVSRTHEYRRPSRHYDPCINMYDGQYILNHDFKKLFPYVDNMCYFVKCANKKAYLNACGPATRNDKKGDGFCSHLDLEGFCGPSLHEYHERKKEKEDRKVQRYEHSYSSPGYSSTSYKSGDRSYTRYQR